MVSRLLLGCCIDPLSGDVEASLVSFSETNQSPAQSLGSCRWEVPHGESSNPQQAITAAATIVESKLTQWAGQESVAPLNLIGIDLLAPSSEWNQALVKMGLQVAERSGVTVHLINPLGPDRAVLCRTIHSLVDWLSFRARRTSRLVVHIGPVCFITYLPANSGWVRTQTFAAPIGTSFVEGLLRTGMNKTTIRDPRGVLAVQGRMLAQLKPHWENHLPTETRPLNETERDLMTRRIVELAVKNKWTLNDLLCSATHLLAELPARIVRRRLRNRLLEEVLFVGPGTRNGFLLRLLEKQFANLGIQRILPEVSNETDYAAFCAATGSGLCLERPFMMQLSDSLENRTPGLLIPGNDESWNHCLNWMLGESKLAEAA